MNIDKLTAAFCAAIVGNDPHCALAPDDVPKARAFCERFVPMVGDIAEQDLAQYIFNVCGGFGHPAVDQGPDLTALTELIDDAEADDGRTSVWHFELETEEWEGGDHVQVIRLITGDDMRELWDAKRNAAPMLPFTVCHVDNGESITVDHVHAASADAALLAAQESGLCDPVIFAGHISAVASA